MCMFRESRRRRKGDERVMIKLEHIVLASPEQMKFIIEGMRNPMNSWGKSDSEYETAGFDLGENDRSLMQRLANAGTDHRKFMRMSPVYVRITAPLYWWKEFDTYKVGTVANSCSTMHKIHAKRFEREDFSIEHILNCDEHHWMVCMDNIISAKEWLEMLTSQKVLSEDVKKEKAEIEVLYFAQEEVNGSK